jgi:hypothetical protein
MLGLALLHIFSTEPDLDLNIRKCPNGSVIATLSFCRCRFIKDMDRPGRNGVGIRPSDAGQQGKEHESHYGSWECKRTKASRCCGSAKKGAMPAQQAGSREKN